jgi:glycosyltransferase involved in cell wall biosynthesis
MMADQPLVSVVIPTYNRAGIIAKTIENIFEQTYRNIELIVVDDGSTDDTISVLKSYGEKLRWTVQENAGPSAARNRGISMAKGKILAFQDSDDAWHPSKIERQVGLLERAGEAVPCCICNTDIYTADGRVINSFANAPLNPPYEEGIWTNVAEVLATRFIIFCQAVAIRKKVLDKTGGFDETLKSLEDHELALRLAFEGPWAFIRTPLVIQRQGTANSISREIIERPILLAEYGKRVHEGILERLPKSADNFRLRALMERQLKHAKRELRLAKRLHGNSPAGRVLGSIGTKVERLRSAVERRLPGYPKMKVQAIQPASGVMMTELRAANAKGVGAPTFQ